jgi:lysozyme family protein
MTDFDKIYEIVRVKFEGGYANVAGDKGGETYAGIARKIHPNEKIWDAIDFYKRTKFAGQTIPHNTHFDDLEFLVRDFYRRQFFDNRVHEIDDPLVGLAVFDYLIHSGPTGIKNIQRLVGVKPDGIIGPVTLAAINERNPRALYAAILSEREQFLTRLADKDETQAQFKTGWLNRVADLRKLANGTNPLVWILILILIIYL